MITTPQNARQELEKKYQDKIKTSSILNRKMVSYQSSKAAPFYRWFSYKEAFSSKMVREIIRQYPIKNGKILDPFSGTSTTLFSARDSGFDSIGIELLPIGEFVFASRLSAENVDINHLSRSINDLKKIDFSTYPISEQSCINHIRITKGAFPEATQRKINAFREYCNNEITDKDIRQLLLFSCFSILEKISFTRKDGQYLRWDHRAGKGRGSFNKGKIWDFEEALYERLKQIFNDISTSQLFLEKPTDDNPTIELKIGSCLDIMPAMEEKSFDLVISSPPYCNRYDYTRTYALELVFLGIGEEEIRDLRQKLLSCTVENKDKISYLQELYRKNDQQELYEAAENAFADTPALQEVIQILEQYRDEKVLNNSGIARMVKNYFYEHSFVIHQMERLLKPGGRVYYVNDNVRYAGETIPVDLILSELAVHSGLEVKAIYKLANGKGNSSQQMGEYGREELRKSVYCWEKPH